MTKDFKNPGLISQVAEFIDKKRIEEGISIDTSVNRPTSANVST